MSTTDLTSTYLGLTLRSPLVASASPATSSPDAVKALTDAGIGAVVLPSLFEEQVRQQEVQDHLLADAIADSDGEASSWFPEVVGREEADDEHRAGTAAYLNTLEQTCAATDVPVIASLNGASIGGWTGIARSMETAGAAAVELNVHMVPGDVTVTGSSVEERVLDVVRDVRAAVSVPVSVKIGPWWSSVGSFAVGLDEAGADGIVLFNRFLQPDIDVETMTVTAGWELSTPAEARLPRTWIAALRGRVKASLAGTSGVETVEDVIAYLLAGADVVMTASALLRHGPSYAAELTTGVSEWLSRKGFRTVSDARGVLAVDEDVDVEAYERAGYVAALEHARQVYGAL